MSHGGVWAHFAALSAATTKAELQIRLDTDFPIAALSVTWDENVTWSDSVASVDLLPRSANRSRVLGQVIFADDAIVATLDLGLLASLNRAFTLRIGLSPNAFQVATVVAAIAIETTESSADRAALVARCGAARSCDACLLVDELCGWGDGACRFGWRDGALGGSPATAWSYATCPTADRSFLLPVLACGAAKRFVFDLGGLSLSGGGGVGGASLSLRALQSPFADQNALFAIYTVAYQLETDVVDVATVCSFETLNATREIGALSWAAPFRGNAYDATVAALASRRKYLVVEVAPEFFNGEQALFDLVAPGDALRVRDVPRLTITRATAGAPPPAFGCDTAATCDACALLSHCRFTAGSGCRPALAGQYPVTCAGRVVIAAAPAASCLVNSLRFGAEPQAALPPFALVGQSSTSLLLTFDVSALRAALGGNARRIASAAVHIRTRFAGRAPSSTPVFGNAAWILPEVPGALVCTNDTLRPTVVVQPRVQVRFPADQAVQPRDLPTTQLPLGVDVVASALVSDTLQLRLSFNASALVFVPGAANEEVFRAPLLVVDLVAAPGADVCAQLTRRDCLATGGCGWCSASTLVGGAACVSGSPLSPFDTTTCSRYAYAEAPAASSVTLAMRTVDVVDDDPWPNLPSLGESVAEAVVSVPPALTSRSFASAQLSLRFVVRPQPIDGSFSFTDESALAFARNNSFLASARASTALLYDAPLPLTYSAAGINVDITVPLRAAAESASRRFVVRVHSSVNGGPAVRVFSGSDLYNVRNAAAVTVVPSPDAAAAVNAACAVLSNCTACQSVETCGWCVSDASTGAGSCVAGTPEGPLLGASCRAWSYSACLPSGTVALFTPLACGSGSVSTEGDGARVDALYPPLVYPRLATLPRSTLVSTAVQVVNVDVAALRTAGNVLSLTGAVRLRLFATRALRGTDFSGLPQPIVAAWALVSSNALNVSVADCTAVQALASNANAAVARTTITRELSAGDAIDLDITTAFVGVTASTRFVRIAFGIASSTPLEFVAPGNCARPRFRPMLVVRSSALTRAGVAQRRTIADDCVADGGLYNDATALPDGAPRRRDVLVGAAQQWIVSEPNATAAQDVPALAEAIYNTLPQTTDVTTVAFAANSTLVVRWFGAAPGRFDLVRASDSLNVSSAAPIRVVLAVNADTAATGTAAVDVVQATRVVGSAPAVAVEPLLLGDDARCFRVPSALASVAANRLTLNVTLERTPRESVRLDETTRVTLSDAGGQRVLLRGSGLAQGGSGAPLCVFESAGDAVLFTNATLLNDTAVQCAATPALDIGLVGVGEIRLSWDGGLCTTTTATAFDVVGTCTKACSGHGQCRLRECVCAGGWQGADCERLVVPVSIAPVPNVTLVEGQPYSVALVVSGSAPIVVAPRVLPSGAALDNLTVSWLSPIGRRSEAHVFSVVADNGGAEPAVATWYVTVNRSVTIGVSHRLANALLPLGDETDLVVRCTPPRPGLQATVWTSSIGEPRTWFELATRAVVTGADGTALVPVAPLEVGVHRFKATRAGDSIDEAEGEAAFEVIDLEFGEPSLPVIALLAGQPRTVSALVTLRNPSLRALTLVEVQLASLGGRFTVSPPSVMAASLAAGANLTISVTLSASAAGNATLVSAGDALQLLARSREGAGDLLAVPVTIVARQGRLELVDARGIKASVPFDEARTVSFAVRNAAPVAARDVVLELGAAASLFSVVAGRFVGDLEANATATITLRVLVASPPSTPRTLVGSLLLRADDGTQLAVPYEITATAVGVGALRVAVEDENTYYGDGRLVGGASARLFNSAGEQVRAFDVNTSASLGVAPELQAADVAEGEYELRVEAPGHLPARQLVAVQRGIVNRVVVFLARASVRYSWRIAPRSVNDEYTIVLDATFETNVPAPVIVSSPNVLRPDRWCSMAQAAEARNDSFVLQWTLTNEGLLRADDLNLEFPTTNPLVTFEKLAPVPSSIDAHQTVVVPVRVRARPGLESCAWPTLPDETRRKRQGGGGCELALVYYTIECSKSVVTVDWYGIILDGPGIPCPGRPGPLKLFGDGPAGGGLGFELPGDAAGGRSLCKDDEKEKTPGEECADALKDLAKGCIGAYFPPAAAVIAAYDFVSALGDDDLVEASEIAKDEIERRAAKRVVEAASKAALGRAAKCASGLLDLRKCNKEALRELLHGLPHSQRMIGRVMGPGGKRAAADDVELLAAEADVVAYAAEIAYETLTYDAFAGDDFLTTLLDEEEGTASADSVWFRALLDALSRAPRVSTPPASTEAALQAVFGATKLAELRAAPYTTARKTALERLALFAAQPNSTARAELVELAQVSSAAYGYANEQGFASPLDGLVARRADLYELEGERKIKEGVCAVVKIQIEQRVSLTRTVFDATLALDNDATVEVGSVHVALQVFDAARRPVAAAVFNVTQRPASLLDSPTAVLAPGAHADLVWVLAPQDAAAPRAPTVYFVGGTLAYRLGASAPTTVELLPERITVQPNPRLRFDYFLERRVLSDDPFTMDVVEPAVPFALGLLVSNDGYGEARDMRVSSSQPKIVENQKGLLIDFEILSARVNDAAAQLSLQAALGTVGALSSASAVWSMRASLQGEFTAFNATFQHQPTNAVDGPQLTSLLSGVTTHRLTRAVTMPASRRVAFLADDVVDAAAMADTLHAGRLAEKVAQLLLENATATAPLYSNATRQLSLAAHASAIAAQNARFYYARLADPLADDVAVLGAESVANNASIVDVWREHYTERFEGMAPNRVRWLHVFANVSDGFVWRLRTAPITTPAVRVENITATTAAIVWSGVAATAVDIDLVRVGRNGTLSVASRWTGAARFVVADLEPGAEYDAVVTGVVDAVRGTAGKARFRTLANGTVLELPPLPTTCTNGTTCANGAQLTTACACACRNGFSGARCDQCAIACVQGRASVIDGKCACACASGWTGALCDELLVGTDGCVRLATARGPSVEVCFGAVRPLSARLVESNNTSSIVAFNASAALAAPVTVTVTKLRPDSDYVLVGGSCTQQTWARATLTATGCSLGSFVVEARATTMGATTTIGENSTTIGENSTTTGAEVTTAVTTVTTVVQAANTTTANGTAALAPMSGGNGGLIGGLVAAAIILLCCLGGGGGFLWWRRKKQEEEEGGKKDGDVQLEEKA